MENTVYCKKIIDKIRKWVSISIMALMLVIKYKSDANGCWEVITRSKKNILGEPQMTWR
jgi:hypothetical protein